MTEKEMQIFGTFAKLIPQMPENKKDYFLGYGDGMAFMAECLRGQPGEEGEAAK